MHYDMPLPGTITSLPPPGAFLHPGTNASATRSLRSGFRVVCVLVPGAYAPGSIVLLWYISLVRCIIGLTETEEWGSYPFFLEIGAPVPRAGSELSIPDQ